MTTTTKIAGEAMTDEWRTAFDDRHEFDVYPEHFMSGLRNEFAAGWHAAMKSQARALLASKPAAHVPLTDDQLELMASQSGLYGVRKAAAAYAREVIAASTAPAQSCGDAEQADEAVTLPPLPEPTEINWPELHSQALGCGVEDRNIRDRYEAAEYGWQDGVDRAAERVPEQIFTAEQMHEYARQAIDASRAKEPK